MEFSNFAPSSSSFQTPIDEPEFLEEENKPDLTRPESYLLSNDWVNALPEERNKMAEKAFVLQADALMAAKGGTIEMNVYRDGKKTRDQVSIHNPDGLLSQQARQYLDQSRQALLMAAQDPDGGVILNGFTNRLEAAPWVSKLVSSDPIRSEADPDYVRFNEFISERTALDTEEKLQGLSFNEFKNWANEGEIDQTKQVEDDPELIKKFNRYIKRLVYDPTSMGDSKAVDLNDGELVINPYNFFEIDQVESEIMAQPIPASQKRIALMDYHAKVNERIMDGVRIFSAADADLFGIPGTAVVGAVINRPLVNDLAAHLEAGGTGIDFLRANKERMSRSSYGVTSEVVATLRDALIATGTGATWLAGAALDKLPGVSGMGEMLSTPAQIWGELAEETAQAYRNPIAFSVGSVDITRRDLTSLTGQVGSFLALGGLGSGATKALGLTAAKEALVAGTAKTATNFGTSLAKLTGEKLGEKTATFLVDAAMDGTAYLAGVQAAGMSFGSTHDAVLKATGDEKEAYRAASIQGLSDGFGALIATSVMNRVAPGAERLLGVKPGKLAGSLIQRIRATKANTAGLAGLLEVQESLKKLSPELIKQFSKDMRASMRKTASNAGLRGIGIGGDIVSEFGEEALDEALSDVIGMIIDDSKSWSAGDWGNIHDNFRHYFKAGILGALGGAMGGAKGAVSSGLRALGSDTKRKAEVKRVIEDEWKLIKRNVTESFANRENLVEGLGGRAVKLAEVLADENIPLKEKSATLVRAARFGKLTSVMDATVPVAPEPSQAAPEEDKEQVAGSTTAPVAAAVSSDQEVIQQITSIPVGRRVKSDVKVEELESVKKGDVEFIPLRVGDVSHAGAKLVSTDSNGKQKITYLNAAQAADQAPNSALKKAFQATIAQEGQGLSGESYAESWSEKDETFKPAPTSTEGAPVHSSQEIADEYGKLSNEELFRRAKWEKTSDSLEADNEESFRAQKRAMTEIKIRGLQEQFEQSKKSDDSNQAADNVGTDEQGKGAEPKGDGVGKTPDAGSDRKDDGNREAGQGTSESTVPAATAEVTPGKNNIEGIIESSPDVNKEVEKILSTGGSLDSVDSWEEAVERFDFPPAGKVSNPLAVAYRKPNGQIGVVVFPAGRELSSKELAKTLRHERIHLEQYAFEDSPEGKTALAKAAPSFDPESPSFDRKLDKRMRRDYQGWDSMDLAGKVRESSRALIEDMLDGKNPEAEAGFLSYLKALLKHLQQAFANDSVMLDYVNGVAARLQISAASEPAATPSLKTAMTLQVFKSKLKLAEGLDFAEQDRSPIEQLPSNRENYPGNKDVWMQKKTGKLFFAPGFLQRVLDNPGISDPVAFVKDSVAALKEGKPLPEFPSTVALVEEVAPEEEPVPFSEATELAEEVEPEAKPEEITAELEQEEAKLEELPAESTVEEVREVAPQLTDTATLAALNSPSKESFLAWLKNFSKGLHRFGDKLWLAVKAMVVALTGISVAPQTTNREIASVAQISPAMEEVIGLDAPSLVESTSIDFSSGLEAEFSNGVLPLPLNEKDNVEPLDPNIFPKPAFVSIDVPGPSVALNPSETENAPVNRLSAESTQDYISSVVPDGVVGITLPGKLAKWWLKQGNSKAVNAGVALLGEKEANSSRIKSMLVSMGVNESPSTFPWCSAFLSWSLNQSGNPTKSLSSRSFLRLGKATKSPSFGDVAVLWNDNPATGGRYGWGGHVGFFLGETDTHVILLSGNSGDSVDVTAFLKTRVLGYRTFDNTQGLLASRSRPKRRTRSRRNKPSLGALGTDTEVQPMPETNLDPRYIVLESELEQETENGSWKQNEDLYYFTPAKGRVLNIAPGETVLLEGSPDSRLFLMSVDNGVWVFKRMELSTLASNWSDGTFEEGVDAFQKQWAETRLGASAQRMAPLLDKLLSGNLDTGEGSAFRALFHDILRTVAPNADAPASITLDGTDFLQATAQELPVTQRFGTVEEARKELEKLKSNPELKRLEKELKQLRSNLPTATDPSRESAEKAAEETERKLNDLNEEIKELSGQIATGSWKNGRSKSSVSLTMEVDYAKLAAMLAKKLGEVDLSDARIRPLVALEASRILAKWIDEEQIHLITLNEEKFSRNEISRFYYSVVSDPENPFYGILVDTVRERFKDKKATADLDDPDALIDENDVYVAGSEFLRKLHQLRISGATSEMAAQQASLLNRAIKEDMKEGESPKLINVIGELLRRYTQRLRMVLNTRWAISRLPESQRMLLDRLNVEYLSAGLQGDVDMVRKKLLTSARKRLELSTSDMEETIGDVSKVYSNALIKLRDLSKEFTQIGLDDILIFKEDEGLRLDPEIEKFVSDSKDYDLGEIQDALDALSEVNSFQLAAMDAYFAREAMEAAELALDFNPSELLDPSRSFDPSGIMATIVKGSPRGSVNDNLALRVERQKLEDIEKQIATKEDVLVAAQARDLREADVSTFRGKRNLLRTYKALTGLLPDYLKPEFTNRLGVDRSFARLKEDAVIAYLALDRNRIDRDLQPLLPELATEPEWVELENLKKQRKAASARVTDLSSALRAMNDPRESKLTPEAARFKDQLERSSASVDLEIAKERYTQFKNYLDAVDEYNKRVNFLSNRAIGQFDFESKDYGLYFQDTQHLPDEERTEPRFGKKTDPSSRAESPGDAFGYDYVPARASVGFGQLPGQTFPKNPPKKAKATEKEVWASIKRTIESNAAFLGREARKDFFLADMMTRTPAGFDRDGYNAGAGFVLDYTEDEDTGRRTYETPEEAFPSFNGLDLMFSIDRKLDAQEEAIATKDQKADFDLGSILNLVNYISRAEKWIQHVMERSDLADEIPIDRNQTKFVAELDGRQTPAGRAQILLDPVLNDLKNQIDGLKERFIDQLSKHFYYSPKTGQSFAESFDLTEDGKLKVKTNSVNAVADFKKMIPVSTTSAFKIAVEATLAAQTAVSLTRRMLKEFNNLNWQENLEREAIRTVRDLAFVPDHSEFLQLREAAYDLVTARNLEFNLNYLSTYPGTYWVGAAYAYEMLEDYRKVNKGGGLEPFMKMVRARLASGQQVGVVRGSKPATEQEQFDFAEAGFLQTRIPTTVAMEGVNPEADVLGINDLGPDQQAYSVFSSGETGASLEDFINQSTGEGVSTQADKAARAQDVLNQSRIKRVTTWLTLIGYRINLDDGDVKDAREFRNDVIRKGLTGEGDINDLITRGIKGLFSGVRGRNSIINSLIDQFNEENPHWKSMRPFSETALINDQFDPELFAVELLEFKASFERKAIEAAKVKNKNQIANGLASVLRVGASGVTNLEIDPKSKNLNTSQRLILDFKDFAEAYKEQNKQALFGLDEKVFSHVSPEEAETIAKLIRRGIERDNLAVYDAALITTEDLWLTTNPFLSLLLTNLPSTRVVNGNRVPIQTLIISPTASQISVSQANEIGPRLFPGRDGMPNVIYAPLVDTSRSDAQAMMQQALLVYGEDASMRQKISDLAAKLRTALNPGFSPDTATVLWNNLGQLESLRGQFENEMLEMNPDKRAQFDRLLMDHVRRVSSSLAESAITEGEITGTGFGSDVLLISLVLTDPNYKRSFDQAYIGTDRDMDLGLSESAIIAIQTAIQQAAGFGMDYEPIRDGKDAEEAPEAVNVMPDPKPLIDLLDPSRMKPIDDRPDIAVTPPSDSLLFNMLGGLLVSAKTSNKRLQPAITDAVIRRNRDTSRDVYEPRTARENLELSDDPLAAPVFADVNKGARGDLRNRYVGSILNLTNPGALGIGPMTNAMNQVRISTQTAALLGQLPSLKADINAKATRLVNLNKSGKLKEVILHQIELTDARIEEITKMLPPQVALELDTERKLIEKSLDGLDETLARNQIKIDEAEALLAKEPDFGLILRRWIGEPASFNQPARPGILQNRKDDLLAKRKDLMRQKDALVAKRNKLKSKGESLVEVDNQLAQWTDEYQVLANEASKIDRLIERSKTEGLGSLIELSDLTNTAVKEAVADQIFELATNLNDWSAGLYEMEAELVQLSLRKRLELVHSREIQGMRDLMSNMRYLVRQREALMETDPSGQVRKGIVVELEGLVAAFNKKTARLNEAVQANLNSHLDRLGLPPRFGLKPLSIVFGDMNTVTDADLNQIARRLSPTRIVSQANSKDLLLNSIFDWAGKEFKAGLAEITGIPVNKKVKKDTFENKQANLEALRRFMQSVEGKSKQEILKLIDLMLPRVEEGGESRIDQVLQMLVLSTAEGQALIDNRTSTEAEEKAKRDAQNDIIEATRQNNRIRQERERILNNDGIYYVGRYRHATKHLGADRKPLSAQVAIELVGEKMVFDPSKSLNRQEIAERNNQLQNWGNNVAARRKFYIEKEAIRRVLKRYSEERIDDHYKKLRGQLDVFNTFDPSRMINEAMDRVRIEDAVIKRRFDQAVSDRDAARERGMSEEALMMLLEHEKGFYTAPVRNLENKTPEEIRQILAEERKTRRAKWQLNPKNLKDRRRLVGTLVNDGAPIVLMAVDARERLLKAFPKKITPQNVNRSMNDIVLRALADHDGSGVFMRQVMAAENNALFAGDDFKLTAGKGMTVSEASKAFSDKFTEKLNSWLDRTRGSKVVLTGENSERSVKMFSSLIEQLVQVYQHSGLRDKKGKLNPTGEKVKALLEAIDKAKFIENNKAMQDFDLIGTYSEAFAELEADSIMKKLVSGLSIHDDFASLTMMKAFHHQDARVRMRFIKDNIARETAIHLQSYLERGFDDGRSGREGSQTYRENARNKIANEAKKLKGNALDQTIGYVLASLEGLNDNNGKGLSQSLGAWVKDFSDSYRDLLQLEKAQKAKWGGKLGIAERFLWANHIELIRDIPLSNKIVEIMKKSGAMSQFMAVTYDVKPEQQFDRDENARQVIEALKKALIAEASNEEAVRSYAKVVHETLLDVYNATAVTLAVLSKPQSDEGSRSIDEEGNFDYWKTRNIDPSRRTYSSVPLRMAYAANPVSKKPKKAKEGKWIPDPADTVSITDSAFFGGAGKREENRSKASVFRPLAINGLAAPLAILDDSIYRINVAPNYEVLRRLTGKVMTQSGIPKVGESMLINSAYRNTNETEDYQEEWNIAMAAVATEIENNIFNDGRNGVVNTAFSQTMTFLASTYVVRALSSIQQIYNQVLPPVAFFVIKKLATGQYREAADFLKIFSQSLSSLATRGSFHNELSDFTRRVSPFIHFRGLDGQDISRNELRSQLRYVDPKSNQFIGKAKQLSGFAAKEYQQLGESALNLFIGSGERIVSRSIFATELLSEIRKRSEDFGSIQIEDLFKTPSGKIPVIASEMARIKVSDMMGQSDQSKKSLLFQSHSDSPVWSSLLRSLVRFSNHTATTASNMTAFMPGLLVKDDNGQTRREAVENILGTIGQNVLFHFAKIHTLVPMLAYLFYLAGGDDDDEATRKAQNFADDWLSSEGDNALVGFGKDLFFGGQKQLFSEKKTADAAQGSALAMLTSKAGLEFASAVPVIGVMAGYSPLSSMLSRNFINPVSEDIASSVTGVEVANAWYEKTRLGVQQYDPQGFESLAELTAPTSVLYDFASASKLAYDAYPTANAFDVSLYLLSEAFAPGRDYRSARQKEMREAAKKEKAKNN